MKIGLINRIPLTAYQNPTLIVSAKEPPRKLSGQEFLYQIGPRWNDRPWHENDISINLGGCNSIDAPVYFGIATASRLTSRWKEHSDAVRDTKEFGPLYRWIRRMGVQNVSFTVIDCFDTRTQALKEEKLLIKELVRHGAKLCNIVHNNGEVFFG